MVQAAAMLTGLWALFLVFTAGWTTETALYAAPGAALACALVAWRLGLLRGEPGKLLGTLRVLDPRVFLGGAFAVLRAAALPGGKIKPALVRVRTRALSAAGGAALANAASAPPGQAAIVVDRDGLLLHALDEDAVDPQALSKLDAHLARETRAGARPA